MFLIDKIQNLLFNNSYELTLYCYWSYQLVSTIIGTGIHQQAVVRLSKDVLLLICEVYFLHVINANVSFH